MVLLDALQKLPLLQMFLATLAIGLAICLSIFLLSRLVVRLSVRLHGIEPEIPLALRESIISAVSAMFALLLAFSAAGIWNDRLQAANAVEREAEALENVRVLAGGLPADLAGKLRDGIARYGTQVVDHDWPAMAAMSSATTSATPAGRRSIRPEKLPTRSTISSTMPSACSTVTRLPPRTSLACRSAA